MVRSRTFSLSLEVQPRSFDSFSSLYVDVADYFAASLEASVDSLAQTCIPHNIVYRVSIFLMAVERVQEFLIERSMAVETHWLLPITTVVASFCFFLSLIVQVQSASDSAVLTGMISLVLVELLVPLSMIGGTTLCCLGTLTGETAAILIAFVWVASACSSDYIRQYIYPNLGHDWRIPKKLGRRSLVRTTLRLLYVRRFLRLDKCGKSERL